MGETEIRTGKACYLGSSRGRWSLEGYTQEWEVNLEAIQTLACGITASSMVAPFPPHILH